MSFDSKPFRWLKSPYLLLSLTALFWAANWVIGRAMRHEMAPVAMGFWRWTLALLILLSSLALYLINQEDSIEAGFLALVTCMVVAPLCLLMIVLYLMARDREDRTLEAEEEALLESHED